MSSECNNLYVINNYEKGIMKKSILALACIAMSSMAFATGPSQVITSSVYNSGSINNTIKTQASVTGIGTSFSGATGTASAVANGTVTGTINPICNGTCPTKSGAVTVEGVVKTSNTGTAFNVSTGGGTGSASSVGTSSAHLSETVKYQGPGQTLTMSGTSTADSGVQVGATTNTGGSATAGNDVKFSGSGLVGSTTCTTGTNCGTTKTTTVFGEVKDSKEQTSWAGTGTMTVDGVVLNNGTTNANASAVTNVTGSFVDPQ